MTAASTPARHARDADATRARLLDAARAVVRETGVAGASARLIARRASVNQALIFYHFGTVAELIEAASNHFVDQAVIDYRDALETVATFDDLVKLARALHQRESDIGNIAFMAQILAASGFDPAIRRAAHYATATWTGHTRIAVEKVLGKGPLSTLIDPRGLADLITASLIGLELHPDDTAAESAYSTLASLGRLVDRANAAGPVIAGLINATIARHQT